jgi:hypothetical protein
MSRSIRTLVALLLVSFALSVSACADATGPTHAACDWTNGNVCH